MKKIIILLILSIFLIADTQSSFPMPPMPPGMFAPMHKNTIKKEDNKTKSKKQNENKMIKSLEDNPCSFIPPMLYKLPPPLLNLVDKCQTKLLKPTKKTVKEKLIKNGFSKNIVIEKIEILKDSNRLYKIKIKNYKDLICDEKIKICFEGKTYYFK